MAYPRNLNPFAPCFYPGFYRVTLLDPVLQQPSFSTNYQPYDATYFAAHPLLFSQPPLSSTLPLHQQPPQTLPDLEYYLIPYELYQGTKPGPTLPKHSPPPVSVKEKKTLSRSPMTPVSSGPRIPRDTGVFRLRRVSGGGGRGRGKWVKSGVYVEKKSPEKVSGQNPVRVPETFERNFKPQKMGSANLQLKKQFHKEILQLSRDSNETTTVMIRNIPNKYTRKLLVEFLDDHCRSENERAKLEEINVVTSYDFLYLPIDFLHRMNAGYAFVNFTDPKAVWRFFEAFDGKSWGLFQSPKKMNITRAKIQGKEALMDHFQKRPLCCSSGEYLPAYFDPPRDGSGRKTKVGTIGRTIGCDGGVVKSLAS